MTNTAFRIARYRTSTPRFSTAAAASSLLRQTNIFRHDVGGRWNQGVAIGFVVGSMLSTGPTPGATIAGARPIVCILCVWPAGTSASPTNLDEQARSARLNVSALAQRAVADELDRRQRMASLDAWLDELDAAHGAPSAKAKAKAEAWLDSATAVRPRRKAAKTSTPPPRGQRAAG